MSPVANYLLTCQNDALRYSSNAFNLDRFIGSSGITMSWHA
jgi:hypothetical protein